jgi:hypothetical protein
VHPPRSPRSSAQRQGAPHAPATGGSSAPLAVALELAATYLLLTTLLEHTKDHPRGISPTSSTRWKGHWMIGHRYYWGYPDT